MVRDVVAPAARDSSSTPSSPTARRASCSTCSRLHALGWRHRIELARRASRRPTSGSATPRNRWRPPLRGPCGVARDAIIPALPSMDPGFVARATPAGSRCGSIPRPPRRALGCAGRCVATATASWRPRLSPPPRSASTSSWSRRACACSRSAAAKATCSRRCSRRRRRRGFLAGDGRAGAARGIPTCTSSQADAHDLRGVCREPFDVIVLSDLVNDVWDVQGLLTGLQRLCHPGTRVIAELLQPPVGAAARGRAAARPRAGRCSKQNWLTVADVDNLLTLADFEVDPRRGRRCCCRCRCRALAPLANRVPGPALAVPPAWRSPTSSWPGPRSRAAARPSRRGLGDRAGAQRGRQHRQPSSRARPRWAAAPS